MEKSLLVTGVAYDLDVSKIGLYNVYDKPGIAYKLFKTLADENVNVDMIIRAPCGITGTILLYLQRVIEKLWNGGKLQPELGSSGYPVTAVCQGIIVGLNARTQVLRRNVKAISEQGINLEMIAPRRSISCLKAEEAEAVRACIRSSTWPGGPVPRVLLTDW